MLVFCEENLEHFILCCLLLCFEAISRQAECYLGEVSLSPDGAVEDFGRVSSLLLKHLGLPLGCPIRLNPYKMVY